MKEHSTIIILLIALLMMMIAGGAVNKMKPAIASYHTMRPENLKWLNFLHLTCLAIMLLPLFMADQQPLFLLFFPDRISIAQTVAFLISFGVIGFFPWKKFSGNSWKMEKETSLPAPSVILYILLRIIFLVVYEWFFRGLMLISVSSWVGISLGITVNVFLYALIHAFKNKKEMIGCIPLGLLLCAFTLWWQSIWPAIIFHLQIAIINEWPPLKQFLPPQKQAAI